MLLLDEPLSALDARLRAEIRDVLKGRAEIRRGSFALTVRARDFENPFVRGLPSPSGGTSGRPSLEGAPQRLWRRHSDAVHRDLADRRLPGSLGALLKTFDTVLSNSTLDHFDGAAQIRVSLAEPARVLRPGGRLLVTLDNPANPLLALSKALPSRCASNRAQSRGTRAIASTSILMPGIASRLTSTRVLAGFASPKNSWRTGLIAGRSSTSVR